MQIEVKSLREARPSPVRPESVGYLGAFGFG